MVMVLVKSTACVLLVFLCAAWLSTARLNPAGAEVNEVSAMKASAATSTTISSKVKGHGENLKKPSAKQVVRKCGNAKPASSVECNRSLRSRLSGEAYAGFVAFSADYHAPRHHPPRNNK